jgi:hypothetical protein
MLTNEDCEIAVYIYGFPWCFHTSQFFIFITFLQNLVSSLSSYMLRTPLHCCFIEIRMEIDGDSSVRWLSLLTNSYSRYIFGYIFSWYIPAVLNVNSFWLKLVYILILRFKDGFCALVSRCHRKSHWRFVISFSKSWKITEDFSKNS